MTKRLKKVGLALFTGGLLLFGLNALADDVTNTKHNLSTGSTQTIHATTGTDEVCVFCHTPHKGTTTAPLWNRATPAGPWTMYSSNTIDMTIAASPQGVSLACLSCHDGATALDNLINAPGSGGYTAGGTSQGWTFTGTGGGNTIPASSVANVGTDLSDDHPISVTYSPSQDPDFYSITTVTGSLTLYSGNVECATCHNPHDNTYGTFLVMSNANSALCKTCHKK